MRHRSNTPAGPRQDKATSPDAGRRRTASIYGTVVTAAVLAAGGGQLTTGLLAATVIVTLVVYWLAEEYAELLGQHTHGGQLPSIELVRSSLAAAWPMVTASFLPLAALLIARLLGASSPNAAWAALGLTVALLVVHGHSAAKAAGLRGMRVVAVTTSAGLLGAAMVILKALLQSQH